MTEDLFGKIQGQSGARIARVKFEDGNTLIEKSCSPTELLLKVRLQKEARKLFDLSDACPQHFPQPLRLRDTGFCLSELTIDPGKASRAQLQVFRVLAKFVWSRKIENRSLPTAVIGKRLMNFLVKRGDIQLIILLGKFMGDSDVEHKEFFVDNYLTHGDPTMENTLFWNDGSFALIDPVPDDEKIPRNCFVDMGKLLQSAFGYEKIKYAPLAVYDYCPEEQVELLVREIRELKGPQGVLYALFWAAVNYHRILHRFEADPIFYEEDMFQGNTISFQEMRKFLESRIERIHFMIMAAE